MVMILRSLGGLCVAVYAVLGLVYSSPTTSQDEQHQIARTATRPVKRSPNNTDDASSCTLEKGNSSGYTLTAYDGNGVGIGSLFDSYRNCGKEYKFCIMTMPTSIAGNGSSNVQRRKHRRVVGCSCVPADCTEYDVAAYFLSKQTVVTEAEAHCNERNEITMGFWVTIAIVCVPTLMTVTASILQGWLSKMILKEGIDADDYERRDRGGRTHWKGIPQPEILVTRASDTPATESKAGLRNVGTSSALRRTLHLTSEGTNSEIDSRDVTHQRLIGGIEVHRALSSQSLSSFSLPDNNNITISTEDGRSKSFSDLSCMDSKESLRCSDSLEPVSLLQEPVVVSSDISVIGYGDIKTSSGVYCDRKTETKTKGSFRIFSVILWKSSIFQCDGTTAPGQSKYSSGLSHVYAMQVIAVWWIILRETAKELATSPVAENSAVNWNQSRGEWLWAGALHWHTFFLTSAMLDMIHIDAAEPQSSICHSFLGHLCRKILRQTPHVAIVVLVWTYVIPTCGEGPFWYVMRENNCEHLWWTNIFYVSNVYPAESSNQCLPWSWFLACDMQMYLFGLFFAMLILKHPKVGVTGLIASVVAVPVLDLLIVYENISVSKSTTGIRENLTQAIEVDPAPDARIRNAEAIFNLLLNKPYYHWVAYAAGIILYSTTKGKSAGRTLRKITVTVLSALCMIGIVVMAMKAENILIDSFSADQHLFISTAGLQMCWLALLIPIVVAVNGVQQGYLRHLLTADFWRIIGRWNLCCLLTSPIILMGFTYGLDYPIRISKLSLTVYVLALVGGAYLASFVVFIFVQKPLQSIVCGILSWISRRCSDRRSEATQRYRRWWTPAYGNSTGGMASHLRFGEAVPASFLESVFTPELRTRFPSTM